MEGGDGGTFPAGVEEDGLADGEMRGECFLDGGGDNIETVAAFRQDFATARGGGGEDERNGARHRREGVF